MPLPVFIGFLLALLLMLVLARAEQECLERENEELRKDVEWFREELFRK